MEPISYSPAAAAKALGVSRSKLYELLAGGEITARKMGRRTVIERIELERFVASLPVASLDAA